MHFQRVIQIYYPANSLTENGKQIGDTMCLDFLSILFLSFFSVLEKSSFPRDIEGGCSLNRVIHWSVEDTELYTHIHRVCLLHSVFPSLSLYFYTRFLFLSRSREIHKSIHNTSFECIYIYLISRFDNNSIYAPCYSVYWLSGSSLNFLRSQTPRSKKMSRFFEQKNG